MGLFPGCVGVPGAGTAVFDQSGVGDQVVWGGASDGGGDNVAGPDLITVARSEMHQPAVSRPPRHAGGAGVLAPFAGSDQ